MGTAPVITIYVRPVRAASTRATSSPGDATAASTCGGQATVCSIAARRTHEAGRRQKRSSRSSRAEVDQRLVRAGDVRIRVKHAVFRVGEYKEKVIHWPFSWLAIASVPAIVYAMLVPVLACAMMQQPDTSHKASSLLKNCWAFERFEANRSGRKTVEDFDNGIQCASFIDGFWSALSSVLPEGSTVANICMPDGITTHTMMMAFITYMEKNPKSLDSPRSFALLASWQEAWPCAQKH